METIACNQIDSHDTKSKEWHDSIMFYICINYVLMIQIWILNTGFTHSSLKYNESKLSVEKQIFAIRWAKSLKTNYIDNVKLFSRWVMDLRRPDLICLVNAGLSLSL